MKSEFEKMIAGEDYRPGDPELTKRRMRARRLCWTYNQSPPEDVELRNTTLRELFGKIGPRFEIEPTFKCDYGSNIYAGDGLFMNFDCVILDVCEVHIGSDVFFAPGVHIYTATHPLNAAERIGGREYGKPVTIGDRVWLGGGAIILPGVTIGDEAVIAAGAVVTRDVPPRTLVAGNPALEKRAIT